MSLFGNWLILLGQPKDIENLNLKNQPLRKLFLIAMCLGWLPGSNLFGQQLFQYSLNMLNPFAANPAYAGLDHSLSATGVYRKQWVNLPGSPVSRHINVHLPLYYLQGGFGINVASDQAGIGKMNAASAAYNYQMPVGKSLLSLGVSGGWYQMSLDGRAIQTPEGIREPFLDHRDEILPTEIISAGTGTIDLGAYFQSESFEFGVSARNLLMGNLDYQSFSYLLQQHYTLLAVYKWDVSRNLTLKPSVFLKSDLTQHQVDFSALLEYNDNIFGGVSFRQHRCPGDFWRGKSERNPARWICLRFDLVRIETGEQRITRDFGPLSVE